MRRRGMILVWCWGVHSILFSLDRANSQDSQSSDSARPKVEWSKYELELKNGETVETQLGAIEVPENRYASTSRKITIRFLRLEGRDGAKGAPTVYLAGGPGQSAIAAAKSRRYEMFDSLRDVGDVILFDQRGTGRSDGLPKWESKIQVPKDQPKTSQLYRELLTEDLKQAVKFWDSKGADYRGYTTGESVDDLNAIRVALGVEKLNLLGISYGTHLALAAVKKYEANFNRIVLVSAEGLDQTVKLPERTKAYFERLQTAIDGDAEASKMYPDVQGLMMRVQKSLEDNETGQTIPASLTRFELQRISSWFVGDPERMGDLLKAYRDSENGRFGFFEWLSRRPPEVRGMPELMDIASGISENRLQKVLRQAKESPLGDALNFPMPCLVEALPRLDLGDEFRSNPVVATPALFFSGTLDGRTYPESHAEIAAGFRNHSIVTVNNAGHNLFFSHPQIVLTIKRFLAGEAVESVELDAEFKLSR